ncbi:PREDICTED: pentatricopeptide repeat-containing protein At1g08070, chloroplastic-like [Tarenaya hassleriana]|uniref:pentatricopeptide repeat-containing protein At1g08070, chloroplastic-like n=1 Tax=Tarenaya hassleriana TaxID=28532 RepID=UPI00053CA035|nr:PREDICTED: pentatricopeptide repeat-containing protein At1g08070, chloroplastic-like [Tarenaya hassleriana]
MLRNLKNRVHVSSNNATVRFFTCSSVAAVSNNSNPQTHFEEQTRNQSGSNVSVSPDTRVYISAVLNCRNIFDVKKIHAHVVVNGVFHVLAIANKLLYMYSQFRAVADAKALFDEMSVKDSVSWSVMVGGFSKSGDILSCLRIFRLIIRSGLNLDSYTLPMVIRVCRDKKDVVVGRLVHDVALKFGLESDRYVCAAFVDMYAKCGMIDGARKLFDEMSQRDLVTWTVMIRAYADSGRADESWLLFERMRNEGIVPDNVAIVTIVNACAKLGALNKALIIHDYIRGMIFKSGVILGTALIDMYAKCGDLDAAREIFDSMREKNVISWSAMIAAYGYHGKARKALELYRMMSKNRISPNGITFLSVLYACSHSGFVEEGLEIFNSMHDYGITADVKHYTCMVDLLGRAGRLDEASRMIEAMTDEKDETLWCSFLGACRIHKNVELAEKAAKSLLELQPQNPGHYILLSNIYANARKWDEVAKIRNLMNQRGLKKIPGYTWIEADKIIHRFSVGDRTHPRSKEIYDKLGNLTEKLELAGYIPDTNFVLHDVDEEAKAGMLSLHSEKLAISFGLLATPEGSPLRITKNLRVCGDCHTFCKYVSEITGRELIVRDANRFHCFKEGSCSCGDYW